MSPPVFFVPPWLTRLDRHKEYCIQIPQVKIQTFLRGNATEVLEKDVSRASDRAYEAIRSMILSGELPAGAQLAEEALAERCGVSRTPVREALRRLESDLLVTRTDTQRSFVADWSIDDVADAFELRAVLEGKAARRAAERMTDAALARIVGRITAWAKRSACPCRTWRCFWKQIGISTQRFSTWPHRAAWQPCWPR
jgi:DNA-binding transcriptional regulator YhcF (GntR family)